MSLPGYHGQYLLADVDDPARSARIQLSEDTLRQHIGGVGLGAHILLQLNAATREALDGPIGFVFSPLVGSSLTTSAKFAVVCKSPLTGRFNDALASSGFAIAGKAAGFDAIFLEGVAAKPSILVVDDGEVRLDDAGDLWGQSTSNTEVGLNERYGGDSERHQQF